MRRRREPPTTSTKRKVSLPLISDHFDYIKCVNTNLIDNGFYERIHKESGISKYISAYQYGKEEYE